MMNMMVQISSLYIAPFISYIHYSKRLQFTIYLLYKPIYLLLLYTTLQGCNFRSF